VIPEGDRRRRQSWIDALVNINPPLLQLLEVSPGVELEQAQEAIVQADPYSPGVEVEQAQDAIVQAGPYSPGVDVDYIQMQLQEPLLESSPGACDCPFCGAQHGLFTTKDHLERTVIRCLHCSYSRPKNYLGAIRTLAQEAVLEESKFNKLVVKPIEQAAENSPGAEVDQVQDIINETWTSWEKEYCAWLADAPFCIHKGENKRIEKFLPVSKTLRLEGMKEGAEYCAIWEVSQCDYDFSGLPLPVCSSIYARESIAQVAQTSPGVELEQAQEASLESKFGRIVYPQPIQNGNKTDKTDTDRVGAGSAELHKPRHIDTAKSDASSKSSENRLDKSQVRNQLLAIPGDCERDRRQALLHQSVELTGAETSTSVELQAQEPISQVAKTSPGVEVDQSQDAIEQVPDNTPDVDPNEGPECFECFDDKFVEDGGFIKPCPRCSEPNLSHQRTQRAIAPVVKKDIEEEPDQNPILTGIALSDRFLARYSPPPQPEIVFTPDADGQLSLLDFEVESVEEPPDPDDFESLDAFREAIARWDSEHPTSSFDHCSDQLPSSEDNDVSSEDHDVSSEDHDVSSEDKPLELSLDSFCLWAHCPAEWYEPAALLEQSRVMELSSVQKTSSTSDFFIPTFGRWGDRSNRSDEPPDTGIFTRWPKPKPPKFPPQAASQPPVNRQSTRYPETIPKLSRNYFIASSLAVTPSRPDRLREVMQCSDHLREGLDNFSSQNQTMRSSFSRRRRSLPL